MPQERRLPILLARPGGQRFDCHACTQCCRDLVVRLLPGERERLEARGWERTLGAPAYVQLRGDWVLNKHPDGRCVFLEPDGRCRIHREQGYHEKPLACRLYPFRIVPGADRWRIGWRFDCPTIARSHGRPVEEHEAEVGQLAREMLPAGTLSPGDEEDAATELVRAAEGLLRRGESGFGDRLAVLATLAGVLCDPSFAGVSGEDFARLIRSLGEGLAETHPPDAGPPTRRQRAMLRVAVFAHCEHVSLDEARSPAHRFARRFTQLRHASRFRRASGAVPLGGDGQPRVSFAQVEQVGAGGDSAAASEMLTRYLRNMLDSRSFYGAAYYGWSVRDGFAALLLRIAITGWLARYHAAAAGRESLAFDDVVKALGRADQSAGRLPALGARSERLRLNYLLRDRGLLRLLHAYSIDEAE